MFKSFLGKYDRLRLAHGIMNHTLLVQAAEHTPIETFPCPIVIVQGQIEQRDAVSSILSLLSGIANLGSGEIADGPRLAYLTESSRGKMTVTLR